MNDVSSWSTSAWDATPDAWSEEPGETLGKRYFCEASLYRLILTSLRRCTVGGKNVRALYEFVARNSDELSFQPGDIITVSTDYDRMD